MKEFRDYLAEGSAKKDQLTKLIKEYGKASESWGINKDDKSMNRAQAAEEKLLKFVNKKIPGI